MPAVTIVAKTLAAACATAGLVAMMAAPAPSWSTVLTGIAALAAFSVLSLIARRGAAAARPAPRPADAEPVSARPAVEPPVADPVIEQDLPAERASGSHPAIYKAMRVRRIGP